MNLFKSLGDPLNMMGGGLLWKPMKKATGLTDAQMIGLGAMAVGAPYMLPAAGSSAAGAATAAPAAAQSGMLSTFSQYAQPMSQALNIAGQTKAMTQEQPMQAMPAQFQPGQGFGGLLNQVDQFDPEKRRQAQQMAVQGLLGGYRG